VVGPAAAARWCCKLADTPVHCEVTVSSRQDRTVLLFEDITERVKAEERINFMAHYDALTGLPNRAYFTEQVEADLERRRQQDAATWPC
jgi:predicted signal transduction protein with EAL and GGDEF domain